MAISLYRIKKWAKMLTGKSNLHVCQDEGKCYSVDSIKGYYNNLTEKVTLYGVEHGTIPLYPNEKGEMIEFAIGIFQYGLASYDLFLMEQNKTYLEDAIYCGEWALKNQHNDGSWDCFGKGVYSSMAQGEAISLLARLYISTQDEKYLQPIMNAKKFLIKPIEEGGVAKKSGDSLILLEYVDKPLVLNGWIFSLWGLLDYCKLFPEDKESKQQYDASFDAMIRKLSEFDNGYWSLYNNEGMMASPFYHHLHINQLRAMFALTSRNEFKEYSEKWEKYSNSWWNRKKAFAVKAIQKLTD